MTQQGYDADNPNIDLLKLKNFTIGRKLKDEEVVGPGCLDRIATLVGTMSTFVSAASVLSPPPSVLHSSQARMWRESGSFAAY